MNITLTETQLSSLAYGAEQRNSSNPNAEPMTVEEFAADILAVACDAYSAARGNARRSAMASNDRLMALADAVIDRPERFDAVEAAVLSELAS